MTTRCKEVAFDLIKDKKVNVYGIIISNCLQDYNDYTNDKSRELTQKEYNFLKEVLI